MAKYHINSKGNPAVCRATKGKCPFGGADQHFESRKEAFAEAERRHEQESGFSADSLEINWGGNVVVTNRVNLSSIEYTETLVQTSPLGKTREFTHNQIVWGDGTVWDTVRDSGGKLDDGGDFPAVVHRQKNPDGTFTTLNQEYYSHGDLHRDGDKPAKIFKVGSNRSVQWWQHDEMKRDGDKPTEVFCNSDGQVLSEHFYTDDRLYHRDGDKPARVLYHGNGKVKREDWYQNGELWREDGKPISVFYSEDGKMQERLWLKDGHQYVTPRGVELEDLGM